MNENAKRHDWRPGLVQHCGNVGCSWHRRPREDMRGNATSVMEYRNPNNGHTAWTKMKRAPRCGGGR